MRPMRRAQSAKTALSAWDFFSLMARRACRPRAPQSSGTGEPRLPRPGNDQIGKRVLVEDVDERFDRFSEHTVDWRRAFDPARKRGAADAFGFHVSRPGDPAHLPP